MIRLGIPLDTPRTFVRRRHGAAWLGTARIALLSLGLCMPPATALAQGRAQRRQSQKAQPTKKVAPVQKEDAADSWDADQEQLADEPAPTEPADESTESTPSTPSSETGETTEEPPENEPEPEGAAVPRRVAEEHRTDAATYRLPEDRVWAPLVWSGGRMHGQVELDVGYARYKYPERQDRPKETLNDMRGRFVLGPTFHHGFAGGDYFLNVVAQFVAWVQEQANEYQINADDVYVQVGDGRKWDLQVGRFMTWRVYHKGLGFDLYTLEDNGASKSYPISNGDFAVHTYEADYIFLRNSPYVGGEVAGRAAFHYYPADILGFELAAAYGLAGNRGSDTLGVRIAADLQWDFLQLTAAGEVRRQAQTGPPSTVQNMGTPQQRTVECTDCDSSKNYGAGGGLRLNLAPVGLGGNFAIGYDRKSQLVGDDRGKPAPDLTGTGRRMSFGGYFELDIGSWLFSRTLILGVGANRTEFVLDNKNKEFHLQSAAYLALPVGVNNAMLKLVASQAQADLYDATDPEGTAYIDQHPESLAFRLRFSTNF
ncbi:MAG: hypothetical protein ABI895_11210 [Deltaproteobacteria bacterium]